MRFSFIIYVICFLACNGMSVSARPNSIRDDNVEKLYNSGLLLANQGKYIDAKDQFLKYISQKDLSEAERYYVTEAIAFCYSKLCQRDSAIYWNEDFVFPPVDKNKISSADSLYRLAYKNIHENSIEEAIRNLNECIKGQKQILGTTHLLTARSKDLLSYAYALENSYQQAIKLKSDALESYNMYYEKNSSTVIGTTMALADLYDYIGDYDNAYSLSQQIIGLLQTDDENYFNIRFRISRYLSVMGKYSEAISYEQETRSLPDLNLYLKLQSNYNLCEYYVAIGKMQDAFSTIDDALAICEKDCLPQEEYAIALNLKANLYSIVGDYINAINTGNIALRIREELYTLHRDLAMSYNNLARYHSFLGLYTEAISLQEKCMHQYVELGDSETPEMAASLNNYSDYFAHQGKIDVAIKYQSQAIEILENIFGRNHPDCAISINNLSKLYSQKKDYKNAIKLCNEVLEIRKQLFGEYHPDVAVSYVNLSAYYLGEKQFNKAIEYNRKSLEIYEKVIGTNNADYARGLQFMANIYKLYNQCDTAITYILKAIDYYKGRFGIHSPQYLDCAKDLAVLYNTVGDNNNAMNSVLEVMELIDEYTLSSFSCLTSNERAQFWEKNKDWYYTQLPQLAYSINTPASKAIFYNSLLTSKGILLSTDIETEKIIQTSNDSLLIQKWGELKRLKSSLNYEYTASNNTNSEIISNLSSEIKDLELYIMGQIKKHGDISKKFRTKWTEVKSVLDDDEVAIEFCAIPITDNNIRYVSLLITSKIESPILIDLFEESEVSWPTRNNVVGDLNDYYYHIWQPIFTQLSNDFKKIYFSPSGKLHNTAIEYAINGDSVLSDTKEFYRLTSTRELVNLKSSSTHMSSAVIYGGLKYETNKDTTDIKDNGLIRDVIKQNNFNYLPGTFVEAERINKLLSENNYQTLKYSGVNGTEDSFYKLSGEEAEIIHLATHGFYYSSDADIEWVSRIISQYPPQQLTKEDASLCRTGLILSNAKNGLAINKNIANNDDGILTAKEISQVNLHGLTLTVLSACKTAQGDVNGDGVFGLQRGFKKAGAQAILMSLWSVNDQATLFLMEHFYYHLLHGESFHKSLILAQSELRSSNDGIFNHPSYWAAFILLDSL